MTVRDVAVYLNVDQKTVYRLAQRGELPGFKVAGTWRFKREDIHEWVEGRKAEVGARARELSTVGRNEDRRPVSTGDHLTAGIAGESNRRVKR